jgi:putative transposase
VLEEVAAWQARPLEPVYPIVFFDALRIKVRDEGVVRNKAVHIALGVRADGSKEILGLWLEQNEGAKFWLRVMNELRHRGVEDVLLAVVDGLKGFPDAIRAVFPEALVQTCWCGRSLNGIRMCHDEVVENHMKETVRGKAYPNWDRHV